MFEKLRRLQAFERRIFPHLQSPLDSVLIAEIGYCQEQGRPLTVKGLLLLNLGAPATVNRHLQRLIRLEVIHKRRARHDQRVHHLELDASVRRIYAKYLRLISRI